MDTRQLSASLGNVDLQRELRDEHLQRVHDDRAQFRAVLEGALTWSRLASQTQDQHDLQRHAEVLLALASEKNREESSDGCGIPEAVEAIMVLSVMADAGDTAASATLHAIASNEGVDRELFQAAAWARLPCPGRVFPLPGSDYFPLLIAADMCGQISDACGLDPITVWGFMSSEATFDHQMLLTAEGRAAVATVVTYAFVGTTDTIH